MSDNKEDKLKSLIRSACPPAEASAAFRQRLINQMMQGGALATGGKIYSLGLSPAVWVILAIILAVAMIIYGVHTIPNPSSVVYSAPLLPLN